MIPRRPSAADVLVALLLLALGATVAQESAGPLRAVGARVVADAALTEHGWGVHTSYLGDHLGGGRLTVALANDGNTPLTITGLALNGRPFDALSDATLFSERIESLTWWQATPQTLPPGGHATLRLRLLDLADLGDPIRLTVESDLGAQTLALEPERSPLWIPFVGFRPGPTGALESAILYLGNRGVTPVTLPDDGGVRLDERPASGRPAQRLVEPGEVVPIEVTLEPPLASGTPLLIEVTTEGGVRTFAGLRAFPAGLSFSFWQLGESDRISDPHLAGHGIDLSTPGASVAVDEPFRVRMAPQRLAERLEARIEDRPGSPTMVQLSGYEEVQLYSDLADITMTHHRQLELALSVTLSWPKPIWYLPQNAWGRNSRPGADERWYPLEDLEHQALTGLAGGAKHLQWFSYWNLWQQGHGRGGGFDATRNQFDLSFTGAVGNPALLDRVGRISLTLRRLEPWLALSAPTGAALSPDGVETTTLISGLDRAVLVVLDRFTPVDLYERSEAGVPPRTLTRLRVETPLPPFVVSERAYLIDPFEGVRELALDSIDGGVAFTLDTFRTGALIVVGDDGDGDALRAAWQALAFVDPDTPLARLAALSERPANGWLLPDHPTRLPLTIANDGDRARQLIDIVLTPLPEALEGEGRPTLIEPGASEGAREIPIQRSPEERFFSPGERDDDRLDLSGPDVADDRVTLEPGAGGIDIGYRSHPDERFAFALTPTVTAEGGEGWLSTDYRRLEIDARGVEAGHAARQHRLFVDFDLDGDGERDGGTRLLLIDRTATDLGGGWRRYRIDIDAAFAERFPDEGAIHGRWRPRFQIELAPDEREPRSTWTLGAMRAFGNARLLLVLPEPLPAGAQRRYDLYLRADEPGRAPSAPLVAGATLPASVGALQATGVDLAFDGAGTLQLTPQGDSDGLLVQRWSAGGEVAARAVLDGAPPHALPAALHPQPGDALEIVTLGPNGGRTFAYRAGADGTLFDLGALRDDGDLDAVWSTSDPAWAIVDGDLAPDGRLTAIAERQLREDEEADDELWFGRVRLLDENGATRWSWPPAGEVVGTVFAVRFDAGGDRLLVAAQIDPIDDQDYEATELLAFDLQASEPSPLWRATAGAGFDEPGRAVHRLVALADGGLLYADWHGQVFRLDPNGATLWRGEIGGYVLALADDGAGGAIGLNFSGAHRFGSDGESEVVARRTEGTEGRALGVAPDASLIAFADTHLTLVGASAVADDTGPLLGRHPRTVAVAEPTGLGPLVAVGASDGRLQLFGPDGVERWSWQDRGSSVADLRFLADGTLLLARERFAYDPDDLWRFRTEVEGWSPTGERLWRSLGPWRGQPSMARLAVDADGGVVAVVGGEVLRIELP